MVGYVNMDGIRAKRKTIITWVVTVLIIGAILFLVSFFHTNIKFTYKREKGSYIITARVPML